MLSSFATNHIVVERLIFALWLDQLTHQRCFLDAVLIDVDRQLVPQKHFYFVLLVADGAGAGQVLIQLEHEGDDVVPVWLEVLFLFVDEVPVVVELLVLYDVPLLEVDSLGVDDLHEGVLVALEVDHYLVGLDFRPQVESDRPEDLFSSYIINRNIFNELNVAFKYYIINIKFDYVKFLLRNKNKKY